MAVGEAENKPTEKLLVLVTVMGFLVPVALYFWLIGADGVDVLHADQWFDVRLIHDWSTGTLSLGQLWAPHGENRVFFQNLLTLLLAQFFHYNVLVEEYFSATLLLVALAPICSGASRSSLPFLACDKPFCGTSARVAPSHSLGQESSWLRNAPPVSMRSTGVDGWRNP